ncbi:MAG: peptidyl-tRNA hydrolase Pth2 [Candidatus Thermoplasmatota archaeon]|nr:peptidyl-tRNA hydrolase Pth2 [Candidatus Thermoplasmatota archaeon]MBS3790692.1 peptidyl-tRNA hydrolase Pth2 [Candidatus Thermoplasmatota archaeon]
MKFGYKLMIVVRDDLNISPGKLAVQASHASVSCAVESEKEKEKYFKKWMREGQKKVLVRCDDVEHMEFLKKRAKKKGLVTKLVTDAGLTEVQSGTKTCLGIGPGPNDLIDEVTGELSLY